MLETRAAVLEFLHEFLSRKRTVQDASWLSSAFYKSSGPSREKRSDGGRVQRELRKLQTLGDYSARRTRPVSRFTAVIGNRKACANRSLMRAH